MAPTPKYVKLNSEKVKLATGSLGIGPGERITQSEKVEVKFLGVNSAPLALMENLRTALLRRIPEAKWILNVELCLEVGSNPGEYSFKVGVTGLFLQSLNNLAKLSNAQVGVLAKLYSTKAKGRNAKQGFEVKKLLESNQHVWTYTWEDFSATLGTDISVDILMLQDELVAFETSVLTAFEPLVMDNWQLLKEKPGDFTVVAGDGTRLPCHKIILTKSPVFESRIYPMGVSNGAVTKFEVKEMTGAGVSALLEYLYCRILPPANSERAEWLQLFQAGRCFMLPELEEDVKGRILEMNPELFDMKFALRLYKFAQSYEGTRGQDLRNKVIEILRSFPVEVLGSDKRLTNLFRENPECGQELFVWSLKFEKHT